MRSWRARQILRCKRFLSSQPGEVRECGMRTEP